jgi:ankyrin repeat protein
VSKIGRRYNFDMRSWAGLLCSILCSSALAWAGTASPDRIRDAAARAIALFQPSQKGWHSQQTCNSCHHQFQAALALQAAREHGIPVDENIAHADAAKSFDYTDLDSAVQYNWVIEPAMDDAYQLVAADAAGMRPNPVTAIYARLLAARQDTAGTWTSFHQRPPSSYSFFTETALTLRAVQLYTHPNEKTIAAAHIARARNWLATQQAPDTEGRTYRLFGLFWAGADRKDLRKLAKELLATQQPDGGWSSLDGRESDAYSTSQALVVLQQAGGVAISDARWQRGIDYLLKTQASDGSWHVATRLHPPASVSPPYFESGYPYGHDQFLSALAADWAVMALARALGPSQKVEMPPLREGAPSAVEAWMNTAIFGSVHQLKQLLDAGLDPNSATRSGTTALMMAAPDTAKMKLLIDRGARVNARAKTGYSALMVAAQYGESATPCMTLLLDRGAEVRVPDGSKAPMFNASPLFLAAYSGNTEILPRLHEAGGKLDQPMLLIGTSAATPLAGAVRFGNSAVARTLLDMGASAEELDRSGITLLDRAVLGNQVEIARLLIARGADVNHADTIGFTPLLYAASIDFGDSAIIDLLLKSGARADVRTKDGLTPLDIARKYKHTHLIASLESGSANARAAR